jgi:peptide/nickel transport system permease protein
VLLSLLRRRLASSALPLLAVFVGVFFLARITGDPSRLYLPLNASAGDRAAFRTTHGLDKSVFAQFVDYLHGLGGLDLGTSLRTGQGAAGMALRAFPATLQLATVTMLLAVLLSVTIGGWAALRPNGLGDRIANFLAMVAASVPDFWLALMGVLIFAVTLKWLPTSGAGGSLTWVLPVATLLVRPTGVLTQVVRGSMVAALGEPYVNLARAKGASEMRIVTHHALRNAAAPAVTVAGDLAVNLINGAVVVETIFGWPGIGKLMIDSILGRDFAVLQAAVLVTALAIFVLNIAIDLCYALLDARVRPQRDGGAVWRRARRLLRAEARPWSAPA